MWREHGDWCRQHRPPMGVDVAARVARAEHLRSDEVVAALETLTLTRAELRSLVAGSILLLPSTADTAPVRGQSAKAQRAATLRLTTLASIGGLPPCPFPSPRTASRRSACAWSGRLTPSSRCSNSRISSARCSSPG